MRHYGYNLVRSYLLKFLFYAQRKLFGYMWDIQGIYNYLNSSSTERVRIKNTKSNLHSIYFSLTWKDLTKVIIKGKLF